MKLKVKKKIVEPKTKAQKVEAHLKSGNTINPMEALNLYGSFRLAAIIHELRKAGMDITTRHTTVGDATFATYNLVKASG